MQIIIFIIIIIIIIKIASNKVKEKVKKIVQTTTPEEVILLDVIVFKYLGHQNNDAIHIMPVLKNNITNKVYIPIPEGYYGNILASYVAINGSALKIKLKNIGRKEVEFGTKGRIFIEQEYGIMETVSNKVNMNHNEYLYEGSISNTTCPLSRGIIYNMTNNNILNELNNAILFKGIVDFDTEEVFRKYIK